MGEFCQTKLPKRKSMTKKQKKIKIEIGENLALVLLSPQFLIILFFLAMAFIIIFGKN